MQICEGNFSAQATADVKRLSSALWDLHLLFGTCFFSIYVTTYQLIVFLGNRIVGSFCYVTTVDYLEDIFVVKWAVGAITHPEILAETKVQRALAVEPTSAPSPLCSMLIMSK